MRVNCHACALMHEFDGDVPRRAECESCGADLHCCLACGFYDASAYNECHEPSADRMVDKERANFCDYFKGSDAAGADKGAGFGGEAGSDAKNELEDLFKK